MKVSCRDCGAMILPATAKRTGGYCMRCRPKFEGLTEFKETKERVLDSFDLVYSDGNTALSTGNNTKAVREYDSAIKIWERAVKQNDDSIPTEMVAMCLTNRGVALTRLGKSEEALHSFNRSLEIFPSFLMALYNKAWLLEDISRYQEAIDAWEEYLRLAKDSSKERDAITEAKKNLTRLKAIAVLQKHQIPIATVGHGSVDSKRKECAQCGEPVGDGYASCPRCGCGRFIYSSDTNVNKIKEVTQWPPASDQTFVPTGTVDLHDKNDAVGLQSLLRSDLLQDTVDFYPSVCKIKTKEKYKTILFTKFPKDVFEDIKESPATCFVPSCVLTDHGPLISLHIEYISPQFLRNLVSLIANLRTQRVGTLVITPPESLNVEIVLDPHSPKERENILQLEHQEKWFQVVAINDFSNFRSLTTPGTQNMALRDARLMADEYIQKIGADQVNFHKALDQFHKSAPPLRSFIFQSFPEYLKRGVISVRSGQEFEMEIRERLYSTVKLDLSNWY